MKVSAHSRKPKLYPWYPTIVLFRPTKPVSEVWFAAKEKCPDEYAAMQGNIIEVQLVLYKPEMHVLVNQLVGSGFRNIHKSVVLCEAHECFIR
jgi:hypothetical protein